VTPLTPSLTPAGTVRDRSANINLSSGEVVSPPDSLEFHAQLANPLGVDQTAAACRALSREIVE
jgi:hypothetical protein